jgi:hypothetical protein
MPSANQSAAGAYSNLSAATPHGTSSGRIDEIVSAHLAKAGVAAAAPAPDEVFLRRVYLDAIGTLPTADEARTFLASHEPDRRAQLIDQLLNRDEFAVYRAMQWSDVLCIKAEFPIDLWPVAAQEYYRWLLESLAANKPYNQFARELVTASGSNFRVGPVNFYRAVENRDPQSLAQAAARVLMGVRTEKWPAERRNQLAVFFSQVGYKPTGEWKEEIVFFDASKPLPNSAVVFPDGSRGRIAAGSDPRLIFADWLTADKNPYFARNIANRIWAWVYGRGIVEEPDDVRPDNPPIYPDLLDELAAELIRSGYDQKQIYRAILNSSVYQQSAVPRGKGAAAAKQFACYPLRRLDAEVLIDAICQITGTSEQYSSAVPEPYTIMPGDERAVALADGSISSAFLETFGRSPRNTGLESERNNKPSTAQRLHMLNSSHIERKIEQGPALDAIFKLGDPRTVVETLYLTILSRYPTPDELKIVADYARANGGNRRQAAVDLTWALVNSTEFLYRH